MSQNLLISAINRHQISILDWEDMSLYFINTAPNSHLPKPGQYFEVQNRRVCDDCHQRMNKMEVAGQSKEMVMSCVRLLVRKTVTEICTCEKIPRSNFEIAICNHHPMKEIHT
jgi:hypothetical protein